jgi:hypothetical protein
MTARVPGGTPRRHVETDPWDRVYDVLRGLDRRITTLERGSRAAPSPLDAQQRTDAPTVDSLAAQLEALGERVDALSPTD